MKPSPIYRLSVILISVILVFAAPVFGDDSTDMLSKSLDLVHQVENPTGNPPTDARQIDLLTQAIAVAQQAPNHRLKGHRVLAIQAIRSAIAEIRADDPNHQAATYLHTADTELSTSVSLAGDSDTPQAEALPPTAPQSSATSTAKVEILNAARNGDLEKVKILLKSNPTLVSSKVDDSGTTPLLAAAAADHKDVVEFLLANKADVNARNCLGFTPLSYAAQQGYKDLAELLLANKADPNIGDNSDLTPLFQASLMGRKEMVELLLAHGADVNAKGKDDSVWAGTTPLYIAACNGWAEVAKVLLAHGADVNAKGHDGLTPLEIAIKNHHDTPQLPVNDVADLLRPPAKELPGTVVASVPPEVTPEMEQAFLVKYKAALEKQNPDALFSLVAVDPNMDAKAKEDLKGFFMFGFALDASNPNRTYSFVPITPGQEDKPSEIDGKMYGDYLPAVVALKTTFAKPAQIPPNGEAVGDSNMPLGIKDHQLMFVGTKEIPGAVPPPEVNKSANFGIEPNLRKVSDKTELENGNAFTSLDEFLSSLKQPSIAILASGESKFEYYAICRIAPNLCVWAGGDKAGQRNYSYYFKARDSNNRELDGYPKWIRLVDVPTDNGQAPNVQGTVFKVPAHYSGPVTVEANYSDDSGKKALTFSRTVDWK